MPTKDRFPLADRSAANTLDLISNLLQSAGTQRVSGAGGREKKKKVQAQRDIGTAWSCPVVQTITGWDSRSIFSEGIIYPRKRF